VSLSERVLLTLAALAGFVGVVLSAMAAHGTSGSELDVAARFLLVHAAALIGLVALIASGMVHTRIGRLAAWVMVLGLMLFCGDLTRRALGGGSLAPMAAPTGGILLMIGWALSGLAAVTGPRR